MKKRQVSKLKKRRRDTETLLLLFKAFLLEYIPISKLLLLDKLIVDARVFDMFNYDED